MIDNFALALTHALMLVAAWRLVQRPELDDEEGGDSGLLRRKASAPSEGDGDA